MAELDFQLFSFVHSFSGVSAPFDAGAVFVAQYVPYALVLGWFVLVVGVPGRRARAYHVALGLLALLLSRGILTEGLRFFMNQPRPFEALGFAPLVAADPGGSFPSGHAAFFFALAAAVWQIDRRWGAVYAVLAFVNGIARVYAGVHWPIDIVGGAAIAALSAVFVLKALEPYRKRLLPAAI